MKRVIIGSVKDRVTLNPSLIRADRPNTLALQHTTFYGFILQVVPGAKSAYSVRRKSRLRQNADRYRPDQRDEAEELLKSIPRFHDLIGV